MVGFEAHPSDSDVYPVVLSVNPHPPPATNDAESADVARAIGFVQCVHALRRVLMTTPVGWLLVSWFAWSRAPHAMVLLWQGIFLCAWLLGIALVQRVVRTGPSLARHAPVVLFVVAMDGACWGSISWLLLGYDKTLDPWLGAVLCGVAAVNAPVYITWFRAYATLMGAIWGTSIVAATVRHYPLISENIIGLTLFCALLTSHMRTIAQRVLDGIGLQLKNQSLAEQLREALNHVRQEAETDALTGQPNRRALDVMLKQQVELARHPERTFSVLLLDIDHFKLVNDTHGHGAGDDTLRAFAQRVREHLRQGDICARYGGEEFVVVLPATTLFAALEVAERLRLGVAEVSLMSVPMVRATVSIGAAQHLPGETAEQLLARADTAVYAAKRGGRNQVRVPDTAMPV